MNRHRLLCMPLAIVALASSACTIHSYTPAAAPARQAPPGPAIAAEARAPQLQSRPAPAPPRAKRQPKAKTQATAKPVFLGSRQVSLRAEKDTIAVGNTGRFRALRMHVSGSPLALYRMRVTFADGSRFEPKTRLHFDQGSWTRRIDLPGHRRRILKVEFWYRSKIARNGKARVQLIGLR